MRAFAIRFRLPRPGFLAREDGVAAVEFALLLPIMLLLYFGGVEVTEAVMVNRQVALTADTVTNIVCQYTTISQSTQMPDILNASTQVMAPNSSANVKVVVSAITIDSHGNATVAWSQTLNGTALTAGAPVTVPASLDIANTTLILGHVTYAYSPAYDFMHVGPFNMSSTVYMSPRDSTTINLAP
jgi:Flp pilus assembly protein TadG